MIVTALRVFLSQLLCLGNCFFNRSNHVEGLFGQIIIFTCKWAKQSVKRKARNKYLHHTVMRQTTKNVIQTSKVVTFQDILKSLDGLFEGHKFPQMSSEHLSNLERLRKETLDLTSTSHSQPVFLRQLIHAQDGNDILQRLVVLKINKYCF